MNNCELPMYKVHTTIQRGDAIRPQGFATSLCANIVLIAVLTLCSFGAFAAVTYQAAGNAVNGTDATGIPAAPAWPAHAVNDIALLFVESTGGQPVTLGVPNGFVEVANSPQTTGAGTVGTRLTVFWARAISTTMPRPQIASPSDHFYARIVTFRGVITTGDPVDVSAGGVKAAASNTVSVTGVTTTVANALIVQAVARDNDSAAAAFSAQTNINLTGIAERLDAGTANGNGGGLGVWAGVKATAGPTGNTTATVSSSVNAFITIALKPQPTGPRYQAAGAAVFGTGAVSPAWPAHLVDDIALLFVESAGGQPATLSIPAGFVEVANSPQISGAGTAGTRLTVFWARATSTAMAAPTIADPGDHVYARILTYRNVNNSGNPWNVTGGGIKTPASTSLTVTGVTTTVANTLIVQGVARDNDSNAAAFSAQTNATLGTITERSDAGRNSGNGGGFAVWDALHTTAGPTGNTTANVASSINAFLTIALAPGSASPAPTYRAVGAAAALGLNWPPHAVDDLALLYVESPGGQPVTLANAAGFAPVLNSPQATGGAANGTQLTVFWARATSTTMAGPTLAGPADHAYARILTYRGVIATGVPWDVTGGGVKAGPSTTLVVGSITTTVANTRVVQAAARDNDSTAAAFGAKTGSALTGIAERTDGGTTTGNGGGFAVWDGAKATAGATNNTTVAVTNSRNAYLSIALKQTAAGPDHYELSLPTASVACAASTVTVTACADSSSPCTNIYTAASGSTATLGASAGSLAATTVTFGATGIASTTLSYAAAANGASSTVTLSGESLAATNLRQCCPDGAGCIVANSCSTVFNTAGFIFSGAADSTVATIPAQVAGIDSNSYYLRAVKTSSTTRACEAALAGPNTVNLAYECNNPSACYGADLMTINGGVATSISRNNNGSVSSYTPVSLTFDVNGNASFLFNYSDVGQVRLYASKAAGGALLTSLAGSTNSFVVAPHHFGFSGMTAGSIKAGNNFSATITAYNGLATPTITPSFGREASAEGVTLTTTLVTPNPVTFPSASNPALTNNVIAGTEFGAGGMVNDAAGVASVNNLAWDEVGSVTLTASLSSGSYLGSGLDATGTSPTVGNFIPDHFDSILLPAASVPMPCPAGLTCPTTYNGFVYSGQPFSVRLYARALSGGTTANYDSSYSLSNAVTLSAWDALGSTTTQNPGTGALTNNTVAPTAFSAGIATTAIPVYTFNASPTSPNNIYIRAVDAVNTSVTSLLAIPANSVEGGVKVVSGRIKISNAYGSELLPLPMRATVQYWNGALWTTSTTDSLTSFNTNLAAVGNVVPVIVTGPLALGNISVATPGVVTVAGGTMVFTLNRPSVTGSADISLNAPPFLLTGSNVAGINPSSPGRATFGVYSGNNNLIYQRESY